MKKNLKNILTISLVLVIALSAVAFASPGTSDDPLVSLSYITDTLIPEIHSYVDNKIAGIKNNGQSGQSESGFVVVDVKKGQKVVCEAGCELILRMGKATVNASEFGGLSDVTAGGDIQQGMSMPSNHLLIVPLSDGRGVTMTVDGKIMIKGTYTIQ